MSRIPTAADVTKVTPTSIPSVRVSAKSQGATVANVLEDSLGAADDIIIAERKRSDERGLMEVEQKVHDWRSGVLHDPENGYYTHKGVNAIGGNQKTLESFDTDLSSIITDSDLSSRGKTRAKEYMARQRTDLHDETARYERGETDIYDKGLLDARIARAVENAATYAFDAEKINEAKSTILDTVSNMQERFGWSEEQADQVWETHTSALHKAVLGRMIAQERGEEAVEYLKVHKKEIDGADISRVEEAVRDAGILQRAQQGADAIIAAGLDYPSRVAKTKQIKNAKLRETTLKLIDQHKARADLLERDADEDLIEASDRKIGEPGAKLSPEEKRALGVRGVKYWEASHHDALSGVAAGFDYDTDEVWLSLTTEQKRRTNLATFREKNSMSGAQYGAYRAELQSIRSGDESEQRQIELKRANHTLGLQIAGEVLSSMGLNVDAKAKKANAGVISQVRGSVRGYIDDYFRDEKTRGQYPSSDEIRRYAFNLLTPGTYPQKEYGGYFGDQRSDLTYRVEVLGTAHEGDFLPDLGETNHGNIANAIGAQPVHIPVIIETLRGALGREPTLAEMQVNYDAAMERMRNTVLLDQMQLDVDAEERVGDFNEGYKKY